MDNSFYKKLAFENIKNNLQIYLPYILTCIGSVGIFYVVSSLISNPWLSSIASEVTFLMQFGHVTVTIFIFIFIFYTNSFLMKRREKEIGLYNILGMEKSHLSKVMFYESLFIAIISFVLGIIFGLIFSNISFVAIVKTLNLADGDKFNINVLDILMTILVFLVLFISVLQMNLRKVKSSNPIELLRGGEVGEKEPKSNFVTTLLGLIFLGGGYFIALTVNSSEVAIALFFVAVILVIIGTFLLFTSGSIVILKLLRKNKRYYYQTKNFISTSNMLYRMKRNAKGLATICILSTIVLVSISTTTALFIGIEDTVKLMAPREYTASFIIENNVEEKSYDEAFAEQELFLQTSSQYFKSENLSLKSAQTYEEMMLSDGTIQMEIINQEANEMLYGTKDVINQDQARLFLPKDATNVDELKKMIPANIELLDDVYETDKAKHLGDGARLVVGSMEIANEVRNQFADKGGFNISHYLKYDFDIENDLSPEQANEIDEKLNQLLEKNGGSLMGQNAARNTFTSLYGGLLFLGIFIGLVFLCATVLTIYYKQVTEGYEDKKSFEILEKVGIDKKDIKRTIRSQIQTVFFLPLLTAGVHIIFAFPMILWIVKALGLINTKVFLHVSIITFVIFTVFYVAVYLFTSRTYYKIIKS